MQSSRASVSRQGKASSGGIEIDQEKNTFLSDNTHRLWNSFVSIAGIICRISTRTSLEKLKCKASSSEFCRRHLRSILICLSLWIPSQDRDFR